MTEKKEYILKILSGPHLGAEVLLDQDRYTLGRDDACEIILNDLEVADAHLTLCVAQDRLRLTALGGSFLVDGREVGGTDAQVDFYQVVTMGNTRFAVGPGDAEWPGLTLPESVSPEPADIPFDTTADKRGFREADTRAKGRRFRPKWILAVSCSCLAVIAVSVITLKSGAVPSPGNQVVIAPATPLEKLNQSIREMGLGDIRAELGETGQILVSGYVRDEGEKKALSDRLGMRFTDLEIKVRVNSAIVGACREVLKASGLAVTVESMGPGQLIFSGSAEEKAAWETKKAMLEQDIPGIRSMAFRITDSQWPAPPAVRDNAPPPRDPAKTTGSGAGEIRLAIRSVNLGRIRYLTLADGQKYFEGSVLENGYVIKSITPERIVVSRFEREKIFLLGGRP